ncbi:hypothetical protein HFO93_04370 [Rhizobium leguminosarum]|uniref:hypothetical protein n=1 Tax=Rhizobium TaxID=379 RepID=UPI00102FEC71|nr:MULTISPECIES: hypothetical protein [Rhizobium]MBY5442723.1 hypothetical protein [Rhizobium leguminosarum]TBA59669.1 hypothetical protein ELH59_17355 [Rhizobium ruizarguesonis]
MAFALSTVGMTYCLGMAVLLLFRRTRKFAFWTGLLAVIITLPLMVVAGVQIDDEAREAGFQNAQDRRDAQKAGISDPKLWSKQRSEFLSKWRSEELQKDAEAQQVKIDAERSSEAACKTDFNCWTNKFQRAATKACAPQVERAAKNNFEWTDSFTSPKFPRALINDSGASITYVGDAIKMQNGFGAWTIMTYECDFDTIAGAVVAVRVNPGPLLK